MHDTKKALADEAVRIVSNIQRRVQVLEKELADFDGRKVYLEAELLAAQVACERLGNFEARIGRNYQCPRCWVRDGTNYTVRAVPSPREYNLLRCDRCGGDWIVS